MAKGVSYEAPFVSEKRKNRNGMLYSEKTLWCGLKKTISVKNII